MPTNTYVALDKVTVGTATPSVTLSSIPQGYTDLVLICSAQTSTSNALRIRFNSDTGNNYSDTQLYGTGTSAGTANDVNVSYIFLGLGNSTASNFDPLIVNIQNYSNSSTNKTVLARHSNSAVAASATVGLWRSTSAITSLTLLNVTGNIAVGSTFSLYGIAAEVGGSTPKATGGTVTSDATYWYHTFTSVGNFVPNQSLSCDILQVAGGGGANNDSSGGGGAGGLLTYTSQSVTATNYSVLVGGGGAYATNGSNSQFGSLTASIGGGRGGGNAGAVGNGGSGGGGTGGGTITAGTGTAGQGNAGGAGFSSDSPYGGGGGGGAGAAGNAGASTSNGNGGIGATSSLLNAMGAATSTGQLSSGNYYYAGGGGGNGGLTTGGTGGLGGGGNGGSSSDQTVSTNGTAYTGGGAGGGNSAVQRSGGSGIVIVRYAK